MSYSSRISVILVLALGLTTFGCARSALDEFLKDPARYNGSWHFTPDSDARLAVDFYDRPSIEAKASLTGVLYLSEQFPFEGTDRTLAWDPQGKRITVEGYAISFEFLRESHLVHYLSGYQLTPGCRIDAGKWIQISLDTETRDEPILFWKEREYITYVRTEGARSCSEVQADLFDNSATDPGADGFWGPFFRLDLISTNTITDVKTVWFEHTERGSFVEERE